MSTGRGIFIVLEGTDGSGKETQCKRLAGRLSKEGYEVAVFDFPQYGQPSSFFVQQYLNGKYGTAEEVGPYTASLFYALDRYAAAARIREALSQGKVVLANRFVGSNMAHQGTKFRHAEERRGFFIWLDNLEFEMLRIPRPTRSFVLRVPAETAQSLVDGKGQRGYTDKKRDLHEADINHLKRSVEVYDDMCRLFPNDFTRIDCTREHKLLDVPTVHEIIWQKVRPLLPPRPRKKTAGANTPSRPAVRQEAPATPAGAPADALTSLGGNVYTFSPTLNHTAVAAAIARLSSANGDVPAVLLEALAGASDKDEQLQRRTLEAYGEHTLQQLTGMHLIIDQASGLLTTAIGQGRQVAYLGQSIRYIPYEQRDNAGNYRYHVPSYLEPQIRGQYKAYLDQIFNLYGELVAGLARFLQQTSASTPENAKLQARDIARAVVPVAAKSAIGLYASGEALERLITRLMSDPLPEARETGEAILAQARTRMPGLVERIATPERGGAAIAHRATVHKKVGRLAREHLPAHYADADQPVTLTKVWPRNELDILPDMLYAHSTVSLQDLRDKSADWPYDIKAKIFEAYIGDRTNANLQPGRALENVHYSWDIVCDYDTFSELQRWRSVQALQQQGLTPRYGYAVPKVIDDAELTDQYEACFDLSLRLHSLLQGAGYMYEAQYATLHGHRLRCQVTYTAREAFRLLAPGPTPHDHTYAYQLLIRSMHEKIGEVHPLIAEAITSPPTLDVRQS